MGQMRSNGIAFIAALIAGGVAAFAADPTSRVYLRADDASPESRIALKVRFDDIAPLSAPVEFEAEVWAEYVLGAVDVSFEAIDDTGRTAYAAELEVEAGKGMTPCAFSWDMGGVSDGHYSIRVEAKESHGSDAAWMTVDARKLTETLLTERATAADSALHSVREHVNGLSAAPLRAKVVVAIAEDYLAAARNAPDDWLRLDEATRHAAATAASVRARLTFAPAGPEAAGAKIGDVATESGMLMSGGRHVFLAGLSGAGFQPGEQGLSLAEVAQRYGLSLLVVDSDASWGGANEFVTVAVRGSLQGAADVVTSIDDAARKREAEAIRSFVSNNSTADLIIPAIAPEFAIAGDAMRRAFRAEVERIYGDRTVLNRAWRTRFPNFDEVDIWPAYERAPYQYDLQTFQRREGTEYIEASFNAARNAAPGRPAAVMLAGDVFAPGESRHGVDYLRVADFGNFAAVRTGPKVQHEVFAKGFPAELAEYCLLRSIAPQTPIVDIAKTPLLDPGWTGELLSRYVYSLLWDGAIEGLDGISLDAWHGGPAGPPSFFAHPAAMEAFATAHLDVNRHMDVVAAFQRAQARLGIVWSDSAKTYQDGGVFLKSALAAYEGCSYAGLKIRFVTEDQVLRGELDGLDVVVVQEVPAMRNDAFDALKAFYESSDAALIRATHPIPYNEHGQSRKDVLPYGIHTFLVHDSMTPKEYLHALDAALAIGHAQGVPRPINEYGYTLEGVRARHARHEGADYLYFINLRTGPVLVHVAGEAQTGQELIRGEAMAFPLWAQPLEPMLIRLDGPTATPLQPLEPTEGGVAPKAVVEAVRAQTR